MSIVRMGRELSSLEVCVHPPKIHGPEVEPGDEHEIAIARRLELAFDGRASGSQQVLPLAVGVDSSKWVRATLVVLLHSRGPWLTAGGAPTTAQVRFTVDNVMLEPEDPSVVLVDGSRTLATSTVITSSSSAPGYSAVPLQTPIGPRVRVQARFTQGATAAGGAQRLSVSLFLVGRRR